MARKITMFELHFDGAQIGPASLDFAEDASASELDATIDEMETETDSELGGEPEMESPERSSGRRRLRTLVAIAGVVSVLSLVGVVARRFRGESADLEIEIDSGREDVIEEEI